MTCLLKQSQNDKETEKETDSVFRIINPTILKDYARVSIKF